MADVHSSADPLALTSAASPEVLEAALQANEAAERRTKEEIHGNEEVHQAEAATPVTELAGPTAQATSLASTALAKGGQDAACAWLELAANTMHTNLEALSRLAQCRSWSEMISIQSNALQANLQQAVEYGEALARASTLAARRTAQVLGEQQQPSR